MASIFGMDLGMDLPSFTQSFGGNGLIIILTLIFVILAGGIIIYMILQQKTFNKKIILFENISGQGYQPTLKDRARLVKIGDGGEEILYLRKKKVYRTAYGKKMGKNTYWFAVGQDGYWYNITLGDLDAKMGMLDIEPIDRDMRYMHVAIRKNITERYRKVGFMEKYGVMLISGIVILIMLGGMWFLIDQIGELLGSTAGIVEKLTPLTDAMQKALSKVDQLCSGGSGIAPAS